MPSSKLWVGVFSIIGLGAFMGCESQRQAEPAWQTSEPVAQSVPEGFQEELVLSGRTEPTAMRFAPDGHVFIAEKSGLLWAYRSIDDSSNPVRVVDLRAAVHNYWDRGLLGLAVHPNYPAVPELYVLYTHDAFADGTGPRWGTGGPNPSTVDNCPDPPGGTNDGCVVYGRLSRIVINPTTLVGTEQPLLSSNWCQQYPSHTIGDLAFGLDGYLYVTGGDGASFNFADFGQDGSPVNPCGDPPGGAMTGTNAQGGALRSQDLVTAGDPTSFDGALLRIDVSGPTAVAPPTNPLVGNAAADDDFIVAMGLRNPFRMTARPGTNEIWIADVGWNAWEEINRVQSPVGTVENFGWPCYEGNGQQSGYASRTLCQGLYSGGVPQGMGMALPFYTYSHSEQVVAGDGCGTGTSSITGLAFNTGSEYPAPYQNALFFADGTRRCIWTMFAGPSGDPNPASRQPFVTKASGRVVDMQMGRDGKLYYVDFDGGSLYRISYFAANTPPVALLVATPPTGPSPLAVSFDARGSRDAEDGTALAFAWDLDEDGAFDDATGSVANTQFTSAGQHVVAVRVTDSGGLSRTASTTIVVNNTPPVPVIDAPLASYLWTANETIAFAGHATDAEDGPLPSGQLSWNLILHHCASPDDCHAHPVTAFPGVSSGTFQAPDHEYPTYLELRLTATDATGGFWWDADWRHRIPLTLTGTLPAAAQSDVPVLVKLDSTRIAYANALPSGADVRFTDETGTPLPYEIEAWNPSGASVLWVKVPQLSQASAGKRVFLYYGNPNATNAASPAAVWANGYAAVWHLGADVGDSTGHGNVGTPVGALATAGAIGGAFQFNGTAAYIDMGASSSLAVATNISLEAWVRVANVSQDNYGRIISKKTAWDAAAGYNLEYNPGLNYLTALGGGADYLRATAVDLDTNWHYLASAASGTSGRLYVDGSDRTSDGTLGTITASTQPLYIGKSPTGEYFSGAIDEARVSSVARTAAWLALQNTSMRDALFSYGVEEQPDTLAASTSVNLQPKTTKLTFETVPPGLSLTARSEAEVTPFEATEIVGSALTVVAPQTQVLGGVTYEFSSWSDGGLATHLVVANAAPAPLVAVYTPAATCSDGAKNGNETGVDCGGSCPPCLGCQPSGCDDANLCTTDACDPALSCTHAPVGCDDANACTTDGCSPATGCTHAPVVCNDSNVCTSDSCSSASGCVFATNTSPCPDDGNACTNDVCNAGACTHPDNGSCSSTAPFQESSGMVVLEAEHFHASVSRQNHSWNLTTNSGSSGGQALTVSPDNGLTVNTGYATTSPELRFQVAFVTTGTYQVWLRGIGPNGDGDSCHAGLDGTAPASADRISTFGTSFGWSKTSIDGPAATLNVTSAGVHTVNLWMREDGFVLDKIVLTTSTSFTPSGTGAAESPRQSSGGCTPADCSDNNPCTTDTCTSGVCQHGPATNGSACTDDSNACTNDTCNGGTCTHPNNTAACTDDGSACTYDVCSGGVCTHPSNGTCSASPCTAYCSSPTTFATNSYQSGNLGTQATCHQTTANLNGGVCGNFASGRTLAVNGKQMACSGGNWSALPAKVNGGYCITTTAGNPAWAYFATW